MSFSHYQQIIVHCGIHKTGTSYLQQVFRTNADTLAQHGIHYPVGPNTYIQRTGNHSIIAANYQKGLDVDAHFQSHVTIESDARCLLISGEEFSRLFLSNGFLEEFIRVASGVEVKFVFYLRRQDHLRESVYAQSVKNGLYGDISQTKYNFDFFETVRPFVEAVGRENVIVRPYNRKKWPDGEIINDFFTAISRPELSEALTLPEEARINTRLSRQHTFVLSRLKTQAAKARMWKFFEKNPLPEDHDGSHFFMSPQARKEFRMHHAASSKAMGDMFGIVDMGDFLGIDDTEVECEWVSFSPDWKALALYLAAFADWEGKQ